MFFEQVVYDDSFYISFRHCILK